MNKRLQLVAILCALVLFLLMAFSTHYKIRLEQLEQSTGILELLAATIPLLSLLLASCFSRKPALQNQSPQQHRHQEQLKHQANRRQPESSARR